MILVLFQVRRNIRPLFQQTALLRNVYDFVTFLGCHVLLGYSVVPFVVLKFGPSVYYFT